MGEDALRVAAHDRAGRVAEPLESAGEHRVTGEGSTRRIDRGGVGQADRLAQDDLLMRERCVQLGDVDVRHVAARRGTSSRRRRRRRRQIARADVGESIRCSMPVIHARSLAQFAGTVAAGQNDRGRAVGDRRAVVGPQGGRDVLGGQQRLDADVTGDLSVGVGLRSSAAALGDRRHLLRGPLSGLEAESGLQARKPTPNPAHSGETRYGSICIARI